MVLDDSSEYSDEVFGEDQDFLAEEQSYPFKEKKMEVGDFILVELELEEGRRAGANVHYVGEILSLEDSTNYNVSFFTAEI